MLNKFIKELLEKHNRVIVPDLGAFLHKAETPQVIYFNEFLRFNDGLLVDHYAEKENIDKIEAAKKIKLLVDNINKELQAKKMYQMEGVGTLIIDANEKIQLKTDVVKGYKAEAETTSKKLPEEKVTNGAKSKAKEKTKSIPEKEIELDVAAEADKSDKSTVKKAAAAEPENIQKTPETPIPPLKKEPEKPSWQKPAQSTKFMEEPDIIYEKRSNKKLIWIIIIVFILGILAAGYFLYFKKYFTDATVNQNKIKSADTLEIYPKKDTTRQASVDNSLLKAATGKYYVIAGCFAQENNADRYVKILTNQGFSAEKFAQIDDLFFVCIGSYNTFEEAQRELNRTRPQIGVNTWIKRY
jgi:nucleoid DNA-binding protein